MGHEDQGTGYDPGATGHELQGRASVATLPKYYVEHVGHGRHQVVSYRKDGKKTIRDVWEDGLNPKSAYEFCRRYNRGERRERYPLAT